MSQHNLDTSPPQYWNTYCQPNQTELLDAERIQCRKRVGNATQPPVHRLP